MSNVGDALSGGGSDATGISDTTLSDASLGDQITGGSGDLSGGNDPAAFGDAGNSFNSFNDIANAVSGGSAGVGGTPTAVQSASMTPPAAAATGGDPTGAAGGTQSNTTPGSSPDQDKQQGGGGKQQDPNYAPPQAVSQLKALLKQLNSGKPAGPTGPTPQGGQNAPFALPTLAAGQTGGQSPGAGGLAALLGSQPAAASLPPLVPGETGAQSPQGAPPLEGGIPNLPGVAPGQTGPQSPQGADPGRPAVDAQGNPVTAAGTPAADTPLPPARPGADQTADAGGGGNITVRKGAQPSVDLPTRVPPGSAALPTKKPGASPAPAPQGPATSSIMRDISGASTGSPTALADLAQAAKVIIPMLPMLAGLFGGGGGRRGGRFHGGRFTHGFGGGLSGFRGGMNAMGHLHQGQHPMGRGAWPYHHPQFGWHMHGRPPGPGWLPLHPTDAQGIVGGGKVRGGQPGDPNAPDPNNPPPGDGRRPAERRHLQSIRLRLQSVRRRARRAGKRRPEHRQQNRQRQPWLDRRPRRQPQRDFAGLFPNPKPPRRDMGDLRAASWRRPLALPDAEERAARRAMERRLTHPDRAVGRPNESHAASTLRPIRRAVDARTGRIAFRPRQRETCRRDAARIHPTAANLAPAASIPTLPVTSQPMVAGGP